ncbi:MAG: cupin domain-containing protein [Elusimicrobia bacterium]|nr:cupin domain-containing protein [Elusimicrobiota bacterium]
MKPSGTGGDAPPMEAEELELFGGLSGVSLFRVRLRPNALHPPVCHYRTDESAYVISGSGRGIIGGRPVKLQAGVLLSIPANTWHQFEAGPQGLEVLALFGPRLSRESPDVHYRDPKVPIG